MTSYKKKVGPSIRKYKHKDKRFSKVSSSDEARMKFREKELEELKKRRKKK